MIIAGKYRLLGGVALACLIAGLLLSDDYRAFTAFRWHGLALFLLPCVPLLLIAAWSTLRFGPPVRARTGRAIIVAASLLALAALGLFDAGRTEPNISRRIVPLILPGFCLLLAWRLPRRGRNALPTALALAAFILVALARQAPFANFSNYDSLNAPVAGLNALVPDGAALIIDFPSGLYDTPLALRYGRAIINGENMTPAEFSRLLAAPVWRERRLCAVVSAFPGSAQPAGGMAALIGNSGVAWRHIGMVEFSWEDTANGAELPVRREPMRVWQHVVELFPSPPAP